MKYDSKMTILIVSCDKYKDVADLSLFFLKQYWPNCKYRILIATEQLDHHSDVAETIICGKDTSWTKEALIALSCISSPYVFLLVDDLFFYEIVDDNEMSNIIDFIEKNDIKYYNFPLHERRNKKYSMCNSNKDVELISADRPYGVTIGKGIWKKEELLKVLGDGTKTAWQIENDFSKSAAKNKNGGVIPFYVQDRRAPFHFAHMISAGKWIPSGVKDMKDHGHEINHTQRGMLSKKQRCKMRLFAIGTHLVPTKLRRPIKYILSKLGIKFATEW